ncbi:hypothetical protein HYN59_15065 [Flavobacterium album]|uniref:DUF4960 domain-containing protein n=1 Tax=Flavobacterium album TaxID=2175091 RepID=A0A2S1R186_9FLAO|nr:DUF4960 domain-containing protein [Flavobacterium album]AWH86346.1 hypothetical protein HYN59_15065 [Flavobacterium album]
MKKVFKKSIHKAGLLLALIAVLFSCEDSFDKTGFENNVAVSVESFSINGTEGVIDNNAGTITVTLPFGSTVNAEVADVVLPEGAELNVDFSQAMNFSQPVAFRVVNGNLFKDYKVNVIVSPPIVSFKINNLAAVINNTAHTINLTLPAGTDLTALQPVIELNEGVSISPASGSTIDFTNPVVFTVTSGSTVVTYTANVGVPVEGITVAFLGTAATREAITNMDEKTACDWLFANYSGAQYLSFTQINSGTSISDIDVIWWHYDSAQTLPSIAYNPAVTTALQNYRANGGNLLLTTFASQYVDALGVVPAGKGPNNVFGDFLPAGGVDSNSWGMSFVGHEEHPIFQGLQTFQSGKANLLQGGTYRLNHTAWWFLPEWGGYNNGAGWRSQTGGINLASESWDDALNGRVTVAEWGNNGNANVVIISMGAYDWYNEPDANGNPSQPNSFITNIQTLTQNSLNYLIGQ